MNGRKAYKSILGTDSCDAYNAPDADKIEVGDLWHLHCSAC